MLVSTNQLVRWIREENRIRFVWPYGKDVCIEFDTADQSRNFAKCLNRIATMPNSEERIVDELQSSGIDNVGEILKNLHTKKVLKWANGSAAIEASAYHAFVEQEPFRDDLSNEYVLDLVDKANAFQPELERTLPTPDMLPNLRSLFSDTGTSKSHVSDSISDREMSTLLALAYGRKQFSTDDADLSSFQGTTPSAGSFFPLKLVVLTVDTLESASPHALRYQRIEHAFERLECGPNSERPVKHMLEFLAEHGQYLLISIMIDLTWSQIKYGNHAYRLALLEAGAIMQNLRLVAPRLGLRNWPSGVAYGPWIKSMLPQCREHLHALSIGFSKDAKD